jgi:hypothetical protein
MPTLAVERAGEDWRLESFLDSLILELDKAQDTLSIKGVTRRLTYTVKDVAVDLYVFPHYEGGKLRFNVARPGENGASRISFQLGSITDRQIREHANEPLKADDVPIEQVEGLDDDVKQSLERIGVTSARDLERIGERRIDVSKVVSDKTGGDKDVSYDKLAGMIAKARRRRLAPTVKSLGTRSEGDTVLLALAGENLKVDEAHDGFPVALLNGERVPVVAARPHMLALRVRREQLGRGANDLKVALDPYAVMTLQLGGGNREEPQ